jgi:TPR repeat protein
MKMAAHAAIFYGEKYFLKCNVTKISLKKLLFWFVLASAFALQSTAYSNDLDKGLIAARAKNYQEAERLWSGEAERGSAAAAHNLAGIYLSGVLGAPNFKKALELLNQAAESSLVDSFVSLGYIYLNGLGVDKDSGKSLEYFKRAAESGSIEGKYRYAESVLKNSKDSEQLKTALLYVQDAGKASYPPALHAIGGMLGSGLFVQKNIQKSIEYYEMAASGGYAESTLALAEIYLNGNEVARDLGKTKKWYVKSAELGSASSYYALGYILTNQKSPASEDLSKGYQYYLKAANMWHEKAQTELAKLLYLGKGTKKDPQQSMKWLNLAASSGNEEAHYLRAVVANDLSKVEISKARSDAKKWFDDNHARPHSHSNGVQNHSLN